MPINVRLLRKVKKHILEEPKRLNMSAWLVKRDFAANVINPELTLNLSDFPACGTIGCLAGWTVMLGDKNYNVKKSTIDIPEKALELLTGLTTADLVADHNDVISALNLWQETRKLFFVQEWPHRFIMKWHNSFKHEHRARILAEVIEDFITTHASKPKKMAKPKEPKDVHPAS